MKTVGLITEYNPFHNGHLYHIEQAKKVTGAEAVIVVMSGNYVQRGTPAIMPKHLRAKAALESGASLVIELPVCYACGSAEFFAKGAVSLLHQLHCVDALCFGSESGDYAQLERIARVAADEPAEYQAALKQFLKQGNSFPLARQKALKHYFADEQLERVLEQPNNILGIEYIKALYQLNSSIKGYTIPRKNSGYHDTRLRDSLSSASAIREVLAVSDMPFELLDQQLPPASAAILRDHYKTRYPVNSNDLSLLLNYKLLSLSRESLAQYVDISPELANRITNSLNDYLSFDQFCELLKTRDITYSRISRMLLHILLDLKKEDFQTFCRTGYTFYAHILGFRKDCTKVLTLLNKYSQIPLITRLSTARLSKPGEIMLQQDILAADIYETVITAKYGDPFINEYTQPLLTV